MHVRVVRQRRTPGVQHQRGADARAQLLRIGGDGLQHLSGHVEQQAVDVGLVLIRQVSDGRGQREDHMVILHRQQIGLAGIEPALGRRALALGAVPIAARVVGHLVSATTLAAQDMAAQRRRAALGDGRHHLELSQAQMTAPSLAPGGTMLTEDVSDLQGGPPIHLRLPVNYSVPGACAV